MQRVVLLGASNLTLSFALVVDTLRANFATPLEIWAAHGHGRSYGTYSRVLGRSLPGISNCRLWQDLAQQPPADRTLALITDIGNDLLYGADVPQIIDWVQACLDQLAQHQPQVVLTALPMDSLRKLSRPRYYAARSLFFPRSRVSYSTMMERVQQLNDAVSQTAEQFGAVSIEPPGDWYGFDPIHVVGRHRAAAWSRHIASWFPDNHELTIAKPSLRRKLKLWRIRPAERLRFGAKQIAAQPSMEMDSETRLWLY